jgi:hypothetical protein
MKTLFRFCRTTLFLLLCHMTIDIAYSQIPTVGLVAFYPFSGNANDASGNGHNGAVNGATLTTDRYGNANSAYYFDGSAWIQVPYSEQLNLTADKTISAWIYISSADNANLPWYPTIVFQSSTDYYHPTYAIQLNTYSGYLNDQYKYSFFFGDDSTNYLCNSTELYPNFLNQWVCVTGTYNFSAGIIKIYINGTLSDSLITGSITSATSTAHDLYFGKNTLYYCYFFGKIDEVAIYNQVLSDQEIAGLCNENFGIRQNPAKNDDLIIYPNPSDNIITIESPVNAAVEITDIKGQLIKSIALKDHSLYIDMSNFSRGIYIIRAMTDKEIITKKLIKQ